MHRRLVALLLSAALALPWAGPAYALRGPQRETPKQRAGLESALQPNVERAGLEERRLADVVGLDRVPVTTTPGKPDALTRLTTAPAILLTLDAGKGTRFEKSWREAGRPGDPPSKILAPVGRLPAGWWTKQAAESLGWPVISVVQYRKDDVMAAYNQHTRHGVVYVESENPAGGTGYAFYHGAAVPGLKDRDTLLVATAGDQPLFDRPVLEAVERAARTRGVDLVIATARFPDPTGKGRIVRDRRTGTMLGSLEQRDIEGGATLGGYRRDELLAIREGLVSIYAMPAKRFFALLADTRNDNAQQQFYVTDIIKMVLEAGGRVETVQIPPGKAPDLTTVQDLDEVAAYMTRQSAGLKKRPKVVSVTAEYGRTHAKALTAMDAAEPVWQEEGLWLEDRWSMDTRPSTGTRLENVFDLSFAAEDDAGQPAAYIYTTNGQPDYPVTNGHPGIFIFRLSVRQDQKGRRLGPLLLLASARAAQARGIGPYVTLEADAKNTHARHVYESLGFVKVGQRADLKKPTITFIEYAVFIETLIQRAEAQLTARYGSEQTAGLEEPWVIAKKRRGSSVWFFGPQDPIAAAYTNELERVDRPTHPIQWKLARIAPAFGVRVTVTSPSRRALLTMAMLKQYERALEHRFDTTVAIQATRPQRGAKGLFRQQVVLYGRVIVREMYVEEEETSTRIQDLRRALTRQLRRRDRTLSRPIIDRQLVVARLDGVRRVSPQRGPAAGMEEESTGLPLVDEEVRVLTAAPFRARTALLERENAELMADLERLRLGHYGSPPLITMLFLDHAVALDRWLRAVVQNVAEDSAQPGGLWDAYELRRAAQRHLLFLARYPEGRARLRERPWLLEKVRDNLTREYTYRGTVLVEAFRALADQTLEALGVPIKPALPSPAAGRSRDLGAGLEEGPPRSVVDIAKAILDPATLARRKPVDWSRLHEALILALQQEPSSPEGVERQVWQGVRDHLHATIGRELAAAGRAVQVQDPLELLRQASRGYGRSHGVDLERKLRDLASLVVVLAEAYRVEAERGPPLAPAPLTSELPPDLYLRRYRDWLIAQWRRSYYREVPAAIVAGFSAPEDSARAPGEPVSFGLLSVLAARLTGLEPTLRSFPELAKAIFEPGVEAIRLIPPALGDPPALLVTFRKPLLDPHSGMTLPAMAMAVLSRSWPIVPALPTARLFGMTDDEFFAAMVQGLQQEQALVEWDPQAVQALVFDAEDPVARQHERRAQLFRLAMDGRLIPRADYELYTPEAAARLARWLGRDASESEVLARHVRSRVETTSQVRRYRRPPATDDVRQQLTNQFETWHRSVAVLLQLGFPNLVGDRDGEERGGVIASHELLPLLGEEYRPLASLFLARLPDRGWVLHAQDVRTLANRLVKFRRVLEEAGPTARDLADALPPPDRAAFLARVNLGLLMALPQNPGQPFRGISTEEVQRALLEQARASFGDGVTRLPVAQGRRQRLRAQHEAVLRALETAIWAAFPDQPDALEQSLRQMEDAAAALQTLGSSAMVAEPPPLRLASPQFVGDLRALQAWVAAALRESQSPSSAEPAPVSLPRYRLLVQISQQARGGQLREALHTIGTVIPQVSGEEAQRLKRFRRDLAVRVAQTTVSAIQAAPPGQAEASRRLVRETQAVLREYPDLLELVMMDAQRQARRLLEQYQESLRQQRLVSEFLQALAEAEPVPAATRAKLQNHFLEVSKQRSLPPLYQAVAALDPSLLPSARRTGLEEDPIVAELRRGPVVFTVRSNGTVSMKTPDGPVAVEIPSDLLASGFFRPGAEVVMVPIPAQPPTWSGVRLVDQVGLSRRPDDVADYRDWRSVTSAKQFVGWLRTLPRDRATIVLYRLRLIAPSWVRQRFPDKLMIQVDSSVYPTVAQTRLLVSAAEANGQALSVDDLLQRFSYRGREVLLIAA